MLNKDKTLPWQIHSETDDGGWGISASCSHGDGTLALESARAAFAFVSASIPLNTHGGGVPCHLEVTSSSISIRVQLEKYLRFYS